MTVISRTGKKNDSEKQKEMMVLYYIICALIMLGMLLSEGKERNILTIFFCIILSPFLVPVFIWIFIADTDNNINSK